MEWLNQLRQSGTLTRFDSHTIHLLEKFTRIIESEASSYNSVPRSGLESITKENEIEDDVISWMAQTINNNSDEAIAMLYSEVIDATSGKLSEHYLEQIVQFQKKVKTVIIFLNVGLHPKTHDTYVTSCYFEGEPIKASHYSLAVLDLENAIVFYCDSEGWNQPITFFNVIDTSLTQLRSLLTDLKGDFLLSIYEVHNSFGTVCTQYGMQHKCVKVGDRKIYPPCAKFYPLQNCSVVCGVCVLVCGALAAYDYPSFRLIVASEPDTVSKLRYLKDITAHNDFLRVIFIKWFMEEKVEVSDLFHGPDVVFVDDDDDGNGAGGGDKGDGDLVDNGNCIDRIGHQSPKTNQESIAELPQLQVYCDSIAAKGDELQRDLNDMFPLINEHSTHSSILSTTNSFAPVIDHASLFSLKTLKKSVKLNTCFGFRWKASGSKNEHGKSNPRKSSWKRTPHDTMQLKYICVNTGCSASFICSSKIRTIGVAEPYRAFKLVSWHTCDAIPDASADLVAYNFDTKSDYPNEPRKSEQNEPKNNVEYVNQADNVEENMEHVNQDDNVDRNVAHVNQDDNAEEQLLFDDIKVRDDWNSHTQDLELSAIDLSAIEGTVHHHDHGNESNKPETEPDFVIDKIIDKECVRNSTMTEQLLIDLGDYDIYDRDDDFDEIMMNVNETELCDRVKDVCDNVVTKSSDSANMEVDHCVDVIIEPGVSTDGDSLGPLNLADISDLPFAEPHSPGVYIFPGRNVKAGRGNQYDKRQWGTGSNYGALTTYTCNQLRTRCVARRYVWICDGNCAGKSKTNPSRDQRCCQKVQEMKCGASLIVKYDGKHCCTVNTGLNDSARIDKDVLKGKNLVERAQNLYGYDKIKVVDSIPEELNGDEIFVLDNKVSNPGLKLQKIINDGRSYSMVKTSNLEMSSLFPGDKSVYVYLLKCKGSKVCCNNDCPFYKRFSVVHQISPPDDKNKGKCTSCDFELQELPCNVKKYVAFQTAVLVGKDGNPILIKYGNGVHSCLAKHKFQETSITEMKEYFKNNPTTPSVAWFNVTSRKILTDAPNSEIHQMVMMHIKPWVLGNAKATALKEILPKTELADIIDYIKEKYLENLPEYGLHLDYHPFSVYCVSCKKVSVDQNEISVCSNCGKCGVNTGKFIFTTSTESLNTMDEMSPGKTLFGRSCHVDHQPSRTKDYNTFEGVCYDPELCLVVTLFTFHMVDEDEFTVSAAFSYLKEVLKKYNKVFDPHGFVRDGANSLRLALNREFEGTPQVTDIFHFKQNAIQMLSNVIGTSNDQIRFLKLMISLSEANCPTVYNQVYTQLHKWIGLKPERKSKLEPYIEWWHSRRGSWSSAFINHQVERHSLAETGNSMMARKGVNKNCSLDKCLQWELLMYMRHKTRLDELKAGGFIPRGTTRVDLHEKEINNMFERVKKDILSTDEAKGFVDSLMKSLRLPQSEYVETATAAFVEENLELTVPSCQSREIDFRYREKKTNNLFVSKEKSAKKPGRPKGSKKKRPSMHDDIDTSESDSDNETAPPPPQKINVMPKNWRNLEQRVEQCNRSYIVASHKMDINGSFRFMVTNPQEPNHESKTVIIDTKQKRTICTCKHFRKLQRLMKAAKSITTFNCKHIVYIMNKIGIPERDPLLAIHELSVDNVTTLENAYFKWTGLLEDRDTQVKNTQHQGQHHYQSSTIHLVQQVDTQQQVYQQPPVSVIQQVNSQHQQQLQSQQPVSNNLQVNIQHQQQPCPKKRYFLSKEIAMTELRKINAQARWFGCVYQREPKQRGPSHQCLTIINGSDQPHKMTKGTLCLRVEYEKVHFVRNDEQNWCIETEKKYFCLNKKCFQNPRKTVNEDSNFSVPQFLSINTAGLNEDDRRKVEYCFNN